LRVFTKIIMGIQIQLAKSAIEEYIRTGKVISPPDNLPQQFYEKKCGVFVSLHKSGELRGCIGTYLPAHKNLAEEIIHNAVAACSQDNRFYPVTAGDLSELKIEVSLLSALKKIKDIKELNPKKYGVIVRCLDHRCGLLLPDLDGVDSVHEQLSIACQKGGIDPKKDAFEVSRFEVEKYS
jgi:AmmeMemoRadiSam system protein A